MNQQANGIFSKANWWWVQGLEPEPNQYVDFSCDVELSNISQSAVLFLTCGSSFTLWVNGKWLAHGPAREIAPWQYYETVDLREYLRTGTNYIRIRAYHLGVPTQSQEPCLAGILVAGQIHTSDATFDLGNLKHWRARPSSSYRAHRRRLNECTGFTEQVDLSADFSAWLHEPAQGQQPAQVATHPLAGRENLMPSAVRLCEGETFFAKPSGERQGWQIWDFGGEVFGFLSIDIETSEPMIAELLHGEKLGTNGLPDYRFGGGDFREMMELPAQRRNWETFEKRALRYAALPASVTVHSLSVREYHRDLKAVWRNSPQFEKIGERDRQILAAAERTILICTDDLLNDCPRRERAQYNDPALYSNAFPKLFGTWEPYKQWMRQYSRGAGTDGVLRACYPSPSTNKFVIPDFSLAWGLNVRRYFEATGDLDSVRECYSTIRAGMEAYEQYADDSGLLRDVRGWVFLCNSFEVAKTPRSAGLNAIWAGAWEHLSVLAKLIGKDDSEEFHRKHIALRKAWRDCFYKGGSIWDADSTPEHRKTVFWNYHYEADRGFFTDEEAGKQSFFLRFFWSESTDHLQLASAGNLRLWCDGELLFDEAPKNPWGAPPVFNSRRIDLASDIRGKELVIEAAYNPIDWEVYIAGSAGKPVQVSVGNCSVTGKMEMKDFLALPIRETSFRPWTAPFFNQITSGYAIESGMLDTDESIAVLKDCLREHYYVPWLKRTTPLMCTPTTDFSLIKDRAVLCNTPHSLAFFCRALARHGLQEQARDLCRNLFGRMLDEGSTTLWEEFAPRSSLCHAWGAMCVDFLLPDPD